MIRQYPINSLIIWESPEKNTINTEEMWGNYIFKDNIGNTTKYLLDGQQRIKSLLGVYKGIVTDKIDFKNFRVNIEQLCLFLSSERNETFDSQKDIFIFSYSPKDNKKTIPLYRILNNDPYTILEESHISYLKKKGLGKLFVKTKLSNLKEIFREYTVPVSRTIGGDITIAPQIFERINVSGTKLDAVEIVIARMYRKKGGFNLRILLESLSNEINSSSSKPSVEKGYFDKEMGVKLISFLLLGSKQTEVFKRLTYENTSENFESIRLAILSAVSFLKASFNVKYLQSLPTNNFLYFTAYLFYKTNLQPTETQKNNLIRLLITMGLNDLKSNKETGITNQELKTIVNNLDYVYEIQTPSVETLITNSQVNHKKTDASNCIHKTLDCIFRMKNPKMLHKATYVDIDAKHIQKHHIFPKSLFEGTSNNYLNFMFIEDTFNNRLNNNLPKYYFKNILNEVYLGNNQEFNDVLESNFISIDFSENGIYHSNVACFLEDRAKNVLDFVNKL